MIVEEDFTAHGLGTIEIDLAELDPDALDAFPVLSKGRRDDERDDELVELYGKMRAAVAEGPRRRRRPGQGRA
jgi:hypothetical protein